MRRFFTTYKRRPDPREDITAKPGDESKSESRNRDPTQNGLNESTVDHYDRGLEILPRKYA